MVIDNLEAIKYYINPSPDRFWFLQRTISGSTKAIIPELKYWMIDIDTKEKDRVSEVIETIKKLRPDSHIRKLPTPNGFHLVTTPFNSLEYYKTISPEIAEIHKNSPILAYFDVSE